VLIRFRIATRFTESDWPRFRNRFKQFAIPVLALYYSQNSWTNDEIDLLVKEMQDYIQKAAN
jgi:hypothetical protein